jgi:predicted SPOUT superfamily RNA methylase MTH1
LASSLARMGCELLALLGDSRFKHTCNLKVVGCLGRLRRQHAQDSESTAECTINLGVDVTMGKHGEPEYKSGSKHKSSVLYRKRLTECLDIGKYLLQDTHITEKQPRLEDF